jgi:hypothetical protein
MLASRRQFDRPRGAREAGFVLPAEEASIVAAAITAAVPE